MISTDAICKTSSLLHHKQAHLCACECAALARISVVAMFIYAHTHMDGCCAAPMSWMNVDAKQATTALPTLGIAHTTVLVSSCTRKSAVQLTKQAMAVVREGKCKCACVHYASYFACKCKCQVNKPSTINTHATYQTNVAPRRREEKALYISQLRQHARQHATRTSAETNM